MFIRDLPPAWKNGLILLSGGLLVWGFYSLWAILAPFFVSVVVAYILNPIIRFIEGLGLSRPWGVLALYVLAIIFGILIAVPVTLNILSEGHILVGRLSAIDVSTLSQEYRTQGRAFIDRYSQNPLVRNYLEISMNNEKVQELAAKGAVFAKDIFIQVIRKIFSLMFSTFSGVIGLFFIPLLTFYLLCDLDLIYQKAVLLVPPIYRESVVRITNDIDVVLSGLMRGQIMAALIFGTMMTIGLWLSGLHFSMLLGPIAGIANLVPYLGGLTTVIMATLISLTQVGISQEILFLLLKIVITLAIVQAVDGFVLQPKIIGENAGLHPLVVMFALVLSGSLFGMVGMFLSIPVTCILKVLLRELYHELYDQAT